MQTERERERDERIQSIFGLLNKDDRGGEEVCVPEFVKICFVLLCFWPLFGVIMN